MLPMIPKPPITPAQKRAAIAVAGAIDLAQIAILPGLGLAYVLDDALDFLAAVILVAICGFKWQFMAAFFLELVPVVDIFPTWTALALTLPTTRPAVKVPPQRVTVTQTGHGATAAQSSAGAGDAAGAQARRTDTGGDVVEVEAVVVPPVQGRGRAE